MTMFVQLTEYLAICPDCIERVEFTPDENANPHGTFEDREWKARIFFISGKEVVLSAEVCKAFHYWWNHRAEVYYVP